MSVLIAHVLYLLGADFLFAGALLVGYGVTGGEWFKANFRSWDHQHAALFGGDGKHSISAYCGRAMLADGQPTAWQIALVLLGGLVNGIFGASHCQDAAKKEFV